MPTAGTWGSRSFKVPGLAVCAGCWPIRHLWVSFAFVHCHVFLPALPMVLNTVFNLWSTNRATRGGDPRPLEGILSGVAHLPNSFDLSGASGLLHE